MLDDGRLTNGQGQTISFSDTMVRLTSNLGAEHLRAGLVGQQTMQVAKDNVMMEVCRHFKPDLLNRLDEIMVFDPLSLEQLRKAAPTEGLKRRF
ncbi:hypothetical protein L7F22_032996 [Adiantum nelumboides]|nr:hypothetical protein [Adiantum nelumboides]